MAKGANQSEPRTLRCLEVWGGNEAVDQGVVMPGLDAWLYSRPSQGEKAGGDLHYVSSCSAGLVTRVLIADVSGHGEAVAEIARKLRGLMRRYINYVDQARLVQGLNEEFGELSEAGGFATAVAATYVVHEDKLTMSNAGHPMPLWYRARSKSWALMSADESSKETDGPDNMPLGIMETTYGQFDVSFRTGDMVVLYTDSLIEARRESGKMLGHDGLLGVVSDLDPSDPEEFMRALLKGVGHCEGGTNSSDDVTVLILRANALKPRMTVRFRMKALWLMVLALLGKLRPGAPAYPWPDTGLLSRVASLLHRVNPRWGA